LGANREIVTDGADGFLASGHAQWVAKLSLLIESADLRERLAVAGRRTVEARFSVDSQKAAYVQVIRDLARTPSR